ncbi:hypothetical protein TNCT_714981 [Trichonephila clavata]|uniref:Uncharacterized protein n=1 Tax=Trichonephila clavata TaxID=2740835 RepID=A0A8X6LJV0_TRICU|nr:hypothetical protein TNCT_714981 [Trichonephila clavata]
MNDYFAYTATYRPKSVSTIVYENVRRGDEKNENRHEYFLQKIPSGPVESLLVIDYVSARVCGQLFFDHSIPSHVLFDGLLFFYCDWLVYMSKCKLKIDSSSVRVELSRGGRYLVMMPEQL